jgi:phenylacetate-CoA ligase
VILEPEVETRPWAEQLALDDTAFREQLAYLRERSPFYREKLADRDDVGLADIARLPLTEKRELRASDAPLGRHLCVEPSEIIRIYSTSGTTGRPTSR